MSTIIFKRQSKFHLREIWHRKLPVITLELLQPACNGELHLISQTHDISTHLQEWLFKMIYPARDELHLCNRKSSCFHSLNRYSSHMFCRYVSISSDQGSSSMTQHGEDIVVYNGIDRFPVSKTIGRQGYFYILLIVLSHEQDRWNQFTALFKNDTPVRFMSRYPAADIDLFFVAAASGSFSCFTAEDRLCGYVSISGDRGSRST
ncbi:hypothetical protein ABKN59_011621 [Abortiporus biennis]